MLPFAASFRRLILAFHNSFLFAARISLRAAIWSVPKIGARRITANKPVSSKGLARTQFEWSAAVSEASRSAFDLLRLTLRAQPRSWDSKLRYCLLPGIPFILWRRWRPVRCQAGL